MDGAVVVTGPLVFRTVAVELNAIAMRVIEVDRFRYTVIAGA